MSILVDQNTRLVTTGITGSEGTFHTLRNRDYGTQVVAGVTPGKGGQDVDGIPVFNTIREAVEQQGANTAMIFVPPRFAADSILEAEEAGIELIIAITEGHPRSRRAQGLSDHQEERSLRVDRPELLRGSCPPVRADVGIIPARAVLPGRATSGSGLASGHADLPGW